MVGGKMKEREKIIKNDTVLTLVQDYSDTVLQERLKEIC